MAGGTSASARGFRSAAARDGTPSARGDGPDGRDPERSDVSGPAFLLYFLHNFLINFTPVNLTKMRLFSISTIDFFRNLCYTQNKLENKTNILTNKNKNNKTKRSNKMTANFEDYRGTAPSAGNISDDAKERIAAFREKHYRFGHKINGLLSK